LVLGLALVLPGVASGQLMENGLRYSDSISAALPQDAWTFVAAVGDTVILRIGTDTFNPRMDLAAPGGSLAKSGFITSAGGRDAELTYVVTNAGTHTVTVSSYYANGAGNYTLHFGKAPGAIQVAPTDQGGPMTNGVRHVGTIDLGDLDLWSFSANSNDNLIVRMGATNFNPFIRLFGPTGLLVASGQSVASGGRDIELTFRATNSGAYTLVTAATYPNTSGPYILTLARAPGAITISPGDDGGPMTSAVQHTATLDIGDLDLWDFTANAGETLLVRMGATGFNPWIRLFGPTGILVASGQSLASGGRDIELSFRTTNSGTYTLVTAGTYPNNFGTYAVSLVRAPGPVTISPGDDGGPMTNGVQHAGTIDIGDLDPWQFSANTGDGLVVRMGTDDYNPHIRLISPLGLIVASGMSTPVGGRDVELVFRATNSGIYTLVAAATYPNNSGGYILTLAQTPGAITVSPGDQGGPLTNGVQHMASLEIGDLDAWNFTAGTGENLVVRMGTTAFNPFLRLYSPQGVLVADEVNGTVGGRDVELSFKTTNAGSYTLVAASAYPNGAGDYILTLAHFPGSPTISAGDEGGALTSGYKHSGQLDVGDLDLWSFTAGAGENFLFRLGTAAANPHLRVYDPSGALVLNSANGTVGGRDLETPLTATNAGTYAVLVDSYYANGATDYILTMARLAGPISVAPGDEGGPMTNEVSYAGSIDLGDLDGWTFLSCRGSPLSVRVDRLDGTLGFAPRLRLYGQRGTLLASAQGTTQATLSYLTTNSGRFILIMGSANLNQSGTYRLTALGITEDELQLCPPVPSGTNYYLGGFGGTPGARLVIYTATDVTLPRAQWTPLATNQFDASGLFELIRPFDRQELERYFLLLQQP
jgi:hypothetical protein